MSSHDFIILLENDFNESYKMVKNAMKYYDSDPNMCCKNFRMVLESIIGDIYTLFGKKPGCKLKHNIDHLNKIVPDVFFNSNIITEMHNLRIIGNAYSHYNYNKTRDVDKDRKTCTVAIKKIAEWLVECKQIYPQYLREQEAKRRKQKERNRKILKVLGVILIIFTCLGLSKFFSKKGGR